MWTRLGRWRWDNVPVPKIHVGTLLVGAYLQRYRPWDVTVDGVRWKPLGWGLVAIGGFVIARTVQIAGETRMDRPHRVITEGPYAHSRHPMYVAWTLVYLGVTLVLRTMWLLLALPAVILATHVVALREERALEERFGDEYREYANRVPRYLSTHRSTLCPLVTHNLSH